MIRALFEAGADVFRLNMSHGTHDDIAKRHAIIRQVEPDLGRPIGILADLQGPKLRVGTFANGAHDLVDGASSAWTWTRRRAIRPACSCRTPRSSPRWSPARRFWSTTARSACGSTTCGKDFADCTVTVGGTISNRKGVNVPDVVLPLAALSEKDRKRPGIRLRTGRGLAGAVLRAAPRRRDRGARAGQGPRRDPVEDRKAGRGEGL
jgi:pyruvate kinase